MLTAPIVQSEITGGQVVVTGPQNEREARHLAAALASGSLPVELSPGPIAAGRRTISGDWLNPGTIGGGAGLLAVGLLAVYRVFQTRRSVEASSESP
ncbi:MAG: SecDF P1 head subdomain-containing protein [Actinomycetota bacterium]